MRKYIVFLIFIMLTALTFYLIWGWSGQIAEDRQSCTMANAKAELLKRAIDELGAVSPEDAALLWSQGVQKRNGALQYAVMSDELKKFYKEGLDKNSPAWVTGYSSPWVEKYELQEVRKTSKGEFIISMQFTLATSTGIEGIHSVKLSVFLEGKYWAINSIQTDEMMQGLSGLSFMR